MKDYETSLTVKRLKSCLHYAPSTGEWTWRKTLSMRRVAGSPAGKRQRTRRGYRIVINIDCHGYKAHRLAWFYMTGEWPPEQVDHKNGDPGDNRWHNLRLASNFQNSGNRGPNKNNTSGFKGVWWNKKVKKWQAKINLGPRQIHLGFHDDLRLAVKAYELAARKQWKEFAPAAAAALGLTASRGVMPVIVER